MKTAIDTNVVVRFLVRDDERQASIARTIFTQDRVVLVASVILEVEWVLRAGFGYDAGMLDTAFSTLLGLPNVEIVGEGELILALDGLRNGMDFADAFHLAHSSEADEFVTFRRDFARRTSKTPDAVPVRLL
ncbi:type II toxin-antitoxin system VapC family toxin [Aureimonas sp. SK2]|uniref:type II toxin-antitoxin system VapC family toxin n=1 Tax=Aureimonas sp. SK2 TaxID=3015992 RepID=UPI002443E460|nr:type II toxin-antitoxin system VapC family toxin [Aureimonas sp. SK2]